MESQFNTLQIVAERFEAINVSDVPCALRKKYCASDSWPQRSAEQIALGLSHVALWQTMMERRLMGAVIFADNVTISSLLPQFLDQLGYRLPDRMAVLRLDTTGVRLKLGRRNRITIGPVLAQRLLSTHPGIGGYVISGEFARQIAGSARLHDTDLETFLFGRSGPLLHVSGVYQAVPALGLAEPIAPPMSNSAVQPLASRLWHAARDAIYFGREALTPARVIPFAGP